MNSPRLEEGVHCGSRKKDRPLHVVANFSDHAKSSLKASGSDIVSWGFCAVVLVSIILRRNDRLAGTTLAAKLNVPMRDGRALASYTVSELTGGEVPAWWMSLSFPGGSQASSAVESRSMHKYSRRVVGPSSFSSARGL